MKDNDWKRIDVIAGGLSGATATAITYPLEVLKTRLQSSTFAFANTLSKSPRHPLQETNTFCRRLGQVSVVRHASLYSYARQMIHNEGYVLFSRGFLSNVVAVSLSKAIYFPVYSGCKRFLVNERKNSENAVVHSFSAACAAFVSCTLTNPVWFLKTRLQLTKRNWLYTKRNWLNKMPLAVEIYRREGIGVFFSGLTASYLGIVETVLHFVLYEFLRGALRERGMTANCGATSVDLSGCMLAAATSKTVATVVAYPHEVFRTRTREQQNVGKPIAILAREILSNEGWRAFYKGLGTHLVRQVPNSAVLFLTYESIMRFADCH